MARFITKITLEFDTGERQQWGGFNDCRGGIISNRQVLRLGI